MGALLHLVHGPQSQDFQRLVIQPAAIGVAHDAMGLRSSRLCQDRRVLDGGRAHRSGMRQAI
jgi:hypothetical protein